MKRTILKTLLPFALMASSNTMLLAADGDLDTSFGGDGKVTLNIDNTHGAADISIQNDGKAVVVGSVYNGGANDDFLLLRYHLDGSLDTTFDGDGKVYTDFNGGNYDVPTSVAIQNDGKIIVAGQTNVTHYGATKDFALARYNSNGSIDTTFGNSGKVITDFGDDDFLQDVVIQNDGKIIVVGSSSNNFALVRYDSNGSVDTTFGSSGKVITDFGGKDGANSIVIQNDGKVIAVGSATANNDSYAHDFALARYNSDGSPDTTFGLEGKVLTDFGTSVDSIYSATIQSDGRIIAVGETRPDGVYDFALARYNPGDGSLDATFGVGGKVTTDFNEDSSDGARGIMIQQSGKIVVAGFSAGDFALARYNPEDGSLDTIFGADGMVTTDFHEEYDGASSVAIYGNGNIIAVGKVGIGDYKYEYGLARYESAPCQEGYHYKQGTLTCIDGAVPEFVPPYLADYAGLIQGTTTNDPNAVPGTDLTLDLPTCGDGSLPTVQGTSTCPPV